MTISENAKDIFRIVSRSLLLGLPVVAVFVCVILSVFVELQARKNRETLNEACFTTARACAETDQQLTYLYATCLDSSVFSEPECYELPETLR